MESLFNSPLFTVWQDPISGVKSYILTKKVAPHQQSFYFTNRSMTNDGRFIWFYCAFPPAGDSYDGRVLGVADLYNSTVSIFPETMFTDASPMVDLKTDEAYWCNKTDIYKRSPIVSEKPVHIGRLPKEISSRGAFLRLATHMTFSADKSEICFDAEVGNRFYVGSVKVTDGKFEVWQEFDTCYNHAQFNPTDKDLMLIARDSWSRKEDGTSMGIETDENGVLMRLWTIRRGEKAKPVKPVDKVACHEWWSADGKSLYYVDWKNGMARIDLTSGKGEIVNNCIFWHGHASADGVYHVGDTYPQDRPFFRGITAKVTFYNSITGKKVDIVTKMPEIYSRENPNKYHIDPHPQFVLNDKVILYTTVVRGETDIAAVYTNDLIEATS